MPLRVACWMGKWFCNWLTKFVHCIDIFVHLTYNESTSRREMIVWLELQPISVSVWIQI